MYIKLGYMNGKICLIERRAPWIIYVDRLFWIHFSGYVYVIENVLVANSQIFEVKIIFCTCKYAMR